MVAQQILGIPILFCFVFTYLLLFQQCSMLYYTALGPSESPSCCFLEPWILLGGAFCFALCWCLGMLNSLRVSQRCCWVSEEFWIINAGQPLGDWLGPHWFFVWLWQGANWIWRVRLQAVGSERGSTHPHSNPKCPHVWENFCLQFFSHVLLTLAPWLQKPQRMTWFWPWHPLTPSDLPFLIMGLVGPSTLPAGTVLWGRISGGCLWPQVWFRLLQHVWP